MSKLSALTIIEGTQLLQGLSPHWRRRLAELSRIVTLREGQVAFREGDEAPGLYCVGSGLVRVFKDGPTGKQLVLHFAHPGHTFAEVAVFGNFAVPASAEAVELSRCALIPSDSLKTLLAEHHDLCLELLSATARWVRSLVSLLEDIALRDAASRVARYLAELSPQEPGCAFSLPVLKKDLASLLNLTQETLSRTLRKLVDAGIIESESDGTVKILDRSQLNRVAAAGFAT